MPKLKWEKHLDSDGIAFPGDYDAHVSGGRYQIRAVQLGYGSSDRRGGYDVSFVPDDAPREHLGSKEFFLPFKRGERYLADAKRVAQEHADVRH